MRRKLCRSCKKPVPEGAVRCPHCGTRPRTSRRASLEAALGAAGCIVPLVIVLLLVTLCAAA